MILCLLSAGDRIASAQDTARADASLSTATVYFGYGAELTHNSTLKLSKRTTQIIISQLSNSIDINTLQISVPENVALLSQQYKIYTPQNAVVIHPMSVKLQDSIKVIQKIQFKNKHLSDIEAQTMEKMNLLIELAIKNSGNKTLASEEALKLINANTSKIETAKTAIFKYEQENERLDAQINDLQDRLNALNLMPQKPASSYGQLLLQVMCSASGDVPVSLSYFTRNAGFTPLYDVRVNSKTNDIKLVYKAAITQSTGINWKQVKLTLSTANPGQGGAAPILSPWYLKIYVKPLYDNLQQPVINNFYQNNIQSVLTKDERNLEEVIVTGYGSAKLQGKAAGVTISGSAMKTVDPSTLAQYTTLTESQLNTNFEIDLPYNIDSDGEIHSVTIKEEKIEAVLKNYAVPKLDRDAYLLAEIADWQKLDLLPGLANIIMDDTYVGRSAIDPNNTADTLNLSLGKDKRVAVKRAQLKEFTSTKTSGNNTKQTFTYELTVKNNKTTQVDLLLKDQYPLSSSKEIEVKLDESSDAAVNEETGILTWKLQLKPGESRKLRFSYTVKFPKSIKIANL